MTRSQFAAACVFFAVLTLFKLVLALGFGAFYVDTDYEIFADLILDGPYHWLHDAELGGAATWHGAIHNWRIIGYPLVIAAVKLMAGEAWVTALIVLQSLLGVGVAAFLFLIVLRLGGSAWWGLFGALCYASSEAMLYDTFVQPDSVYAAVIMLAAGPMFLWAVEGRAATVGKALAVGLAFVAAFLLRDVTTALVALFLPLALIWVWRGERRMAMRLLLCLLVVAPTWLAAAAYGQWNQYRTSHSFVTLGGRTVFMIPLAHLEQHGAPVFTKGELIDRVALDFIARFPIPDHDFRPRRVAEWAIMEGVNQELWEEHGLNGLVIHQEISARFKQALRDHPLAFVAYAASLDKRTLFLFWNPIKPTLPFELHNVSNDDRGIGGLFNRVKGLGMVGEVAILAVQVIPKPFTVAMAAAFFIAFPIYYLAVLYRRRGTDMPRLHALAALWAVFTGSIAAYALLVVETRYLIYALPFAIVVALETLRIGTMWARQRGE